MRILHGAHESNIEEGKQFSDWVLSIGDGTVGEINDVDIIVSIHLTYLL